MSEYRLEFKSQDEMLRAIHCIDALAGLNPEVIPDLIAISEEIGSPLLRLEHRVRRERAVSVLSRLFTEQRQKCHDCDRGYAKTLPVSVCTVCNGTSFVPFTRLKGATP